MLASKQVILRYMSAAGEIAQNQAGSQRSGRGPLDRRRLIFAIVSIGLFMASIDQTIVATALPAIETRTARHHQLERVDDLDLRARPGHRHADGREDQRHVRPQEGLHDLGGDLHPRPRCAAGSRRNMAVLLLARFIQALGGGAFMPSATGIVSDHFGAERDRAVGMFTSILPIGGMIGPGPRRPVRQLLVLARHLPGQRADRHGPDSADGASSSPPPPLRPASRIDIPGILLLAGLIATGDVRHHLPGQRARAALQPGLPRLPGVRGRARLPVRQALAADAAPFVPYRLLRGRGFGIMNLINYLYGAAALGFAALVPLYATDRYGISAARRGDAADRAGGRDDRGRRGGGDGAAADRVPVADDPRLRWSWRAGW